jgi:hypothetical protein
METFLIKVNRGLVPLRGREHGSVDIRLVEQYLENRPIHTSAILESGQRSFSWSSKRCQLCNLVLRNYGKFFEQRLPYALIPVLGSYVEVFKL